MEPTALAYVDAKRAADSCGVHLKTLYDWLRAGAIVGRRLANGRGPWRVQLDADGLVVDSPS
jgi:predicted site-specific integrase-resolvase